MGRDFTARRVRKNPDFIAVTRELDRLGLAWTLHRPRSKGHPYLLINGFRRAIASTPNGGLNSDAVVSSLRRWLREHGLIV